MKRYPFLDWTRGLAVLIMMECHVFNAFTRMDLREGGSYVLSQFVGGMAAPLFLFMAGMTLAFQMDSLERREPRALARWIGALRRGGYVLGIAYLFRISNWVSGLPRRGLWGVLAEWREVLKVDILNCMGAAMLAMAVAAMLPFASRVRFAVGAGLAFACASPLVSGVDFSGMPVLVHDYLAPGGGRFPFFPWSAYLAFGVAAGAVVKRTPEERMERLMQWSVLVGFALVFGAQYFSNIPFSFYEKSDFWVNSPALILIRTGICLLMLAAAYLWTEYCVGAGWSWMQALGKTSLMVYWVHVMMVYGDIIKPLKRGLNIPQATLAFVVVTLSMVALAAARLRWSARQRERVPRVAVEAVAR